MVKVEGTVYRTADDPRANGGCGKMIEVDLLLHEEFCWPHVHGTLRVTKRVQTIKSRAVYTDGAGRPRSEGEARSDGIFEQKSEGASGRKKSRPS